MTARLPPADASGSGSPFFSSLNDLRAACLDLPAGDPKAAKAAVERQDQLTKPPGSLGRLEDIVVWLARWQQRSMPCLDRVDILVFAGNHGVTKQGVSAYPAEVTAQIGARWVKWRTSALMISFTQSASQKASPAKTTSQRRRSTSTAYM